MLASQQQHIVINIALTNLMYKKWTGHITEQRGGGCL